MVAGSGDGRLLISLPHMVSFSKSQPQSNGRNNILLELSLTGFRFWKLKINSINTLKFKNCTTFSITAENKIQIHFSG